MSTITTACRLPQDQNMEFTLMRHGESDHNVTYVPNEQGELVKGFYNSDPRHPGYTPSHLTEKGKEQARHTAIRLLSEGMEPGSIRRVIISELPRTLETAMLVKEAGLFADDVEIITDPRLNELQVGDAEGKAVLPSWYDVTKREDAEKLSEVDERVSAFVRDHLPGGMRGVLVVTHGVVATALKKYFGIPTATRLETGEAISVRLLQEAVASR